MRSIIGPMHDALVDFVHLVFRVHLRDGAWPGAGACRFGIEAFAGAERKIPDAEQLRIACTVSTATRACERMIEQVLGRAVARMTGRHGRRGNSKDANRAGIAARITRERMRLVRQAAALRLLCFADQHPAVFDLDVMRRDVIGFVTRFTLTGAPMKLVVMPGADDVVAIERAIAERAADMIADARNRAELAVLEGQRDAFRSDAEFLHRFFGKLVVGADIDPVSFGHERLSPRNSFRTTSLSPDQISETAQTLISTKPSGSATSRMVSSVMSVGSFADFFGQETQIGVSTSSFLR